LATTSNTYIDWGPRRATR